MRAKICVGRTLFSSLRNLYGAGLMRVRPNAGRAWCGPGLNGPSWPVRPSLVNIVSLYHLVIVNSIFDKAISIHEHTLDKIIRISHIYELDLWVVVCIWKLFFWVKSTHSFVMFDGFFCSQALVLDYFLCLILYRKLFSVY